MKTRLLLFMALLTSAIGLSQINVSESFETAFPAGWTTSGQITGFSRGTTTFACDGTYALSAGLYPANSFAMVVTSGYVSDGNAIQTSFKYNRGIGAVTGNVFLYYDINNSGTWQQIATSSNLSGGCTLLSAFIPSASVPTGSVVRFRMQINSTSNISVFIDDFKAIQQPFVMEYNFNNTFSNTDGALPFTTGVANASFVVDRNGNSSSAVQINANASGIQTVIGALPKTNAPRTFSIWYKTSANNNVDLFTYGTACANCTFGTYIGTNGNPAFATGSTGTDFGGTYPINIWRHLLITYNGTDVKLFLNGQLLGTAAHALVTGNNSSFRLGGSAATITVDDLKIYDAVLTDTQAFNLYNYNTITAPTPVVPIISAVSSSPEDIISTISYTINANYAPTTTVVNFGTSSNNLSNQQVGFSTNGSSQTTENVTLSGLVVNTQYFYQIVATNSAGTSTSAVLNFTTLTTPPAVAEYNFNNTYNNINGNSPFAANNGTSFESDRNSSALSALRLNGIGSSTVIAGLPTGSSIRSISIWYKVASATTDNCLFVYGQSGQENAYGVSFNNTNTWYNFAWNTNTSMTNPSNDGLWHHLVTTYDQAKTSRIYVDGVLKNTVLQNGWNTTANGNTFWLGSLFSPSASAFTGTVDDLKIYNYSLSQANVTSLFNNNTLSSSNFQSNNLKFNLYPNPATDILNISMETELKSVEIYSLLGQKVLTSDQKQVNVSNLSKGMYMVRVENVEGSVSTQKLIVE